MTTLYILHFDLPIEHAGHYSGCTTHLFSRLWDHATGHGSRLTQVCHEQGIDWILAAVMVGSFTDEQRLKAMHSAPLYCPLCSKEETRTLQGCTPYPVEIVQQQFPIRSEIIRKESRPCPPTHIS